MLRSREMRNQKRLRRAAIVPSYGHHVASAHPPGGFRRAVKPEAEEDWSKEKWRAYRIDLWDADGENVIEHLAGIEDLQVAMATYLAACQRWPGAPITLRQGTRVIEDNRRTRLG